MRNTGRAGRQFTAIIYLTIPLHYGTFRAEVNPTLEEAGMLEIDGDAAVLRGTNGVLRLRDDDEVARRLAMLFEGECEGLGPTAAARKLGLTKQRYSQLLHLFEQQGAAGLEPHKRGPKGPSKRTEAVMRQIIRYRFLDPDASPDVIAQKLRQNGWPIAQRSVERVIAEFGLQKKTLRLSTGRRVCKHAALE